MSDANLKANHLPSGPGGVRRLNRLPLAIIGAILVVALAAMSWAVYQRGQARLQAQDEDTEVIGVEDTQPVVDSLLGGYAGIVEAPAPDIPPPLQETEPEVVYIEAAPEPPPPVTAVPPPPPPVKELEISPEELDRQQRLRQAQQRAFQLAAQALSAPTAVPGSSLQNANKPEVTLTSGSLNGVTSAGTTSPDYRLLQQQALSRALHNPQLNTGINYNPLAALLAGRNQNLATSLTDLQQGGTRQAHNNCFNQQQGFTYSRERRQAQLTQTELRVGTLIPAVMISGINSDLPGEMLAQVTEDVRDTRSGEAVLIPQGSKLVGRYTSDIEEGQELVLVAWYRVNFPDGSFLNLDAMNAVDEAGYSGFYDQVNKHTVEKFKEATLLSLISGAAQLSQSDSGEVAQQLAASLGQQWGQVGQEVVRRKLDRDPTLEIRAGYRFNVFINRDLILKPYQVMAPLSSIHQ